MFKGRQFNQPGMLLCVRRYLAYNLSLRDLEMMAERGIAVDHTTIHRWTVRFAPLLLEHFNRRKHSVTGKRHVDETHIKVRGQWCIRSVLGFTSPPSAVIIVNGIEMAHMMRKQHARFAFNPNPSLVEQFQILAA
ncbi:hypothetical protein [Mesorhizobium sp. M0772]|uniref:hypothetical protein n=1 Tax=Mesorhizobium sp. M0772 TaxID=2956998 RepID=UPI003335F940